MDISGLGSDYLNSYASLTNSVDSSSLSASEVKGKLNNISSESSDEELMEACKSFESYMLEQVYKNMRESVKLINEDDTDDNDYMQMFGDNLYEEYANQAVENSSLGIAQMLFDSIKKGN